MSPIHLNKSFSFHLGIIICPNFLAAIRCLYKIVSDSSPLGHLLGEFLVHQTCSKNLESPALVLGRDINGGGTGSRKTFLTWCCDLSSCMETVIPDGTWVKRTADSVLFTCYELWVRP